MTSLHPISKIDELANWAIEIYFTRAASEFEVSKVKKQLVRLLDNDRSDIAMGHMALGLLELYCGKIDQAYSYVNNARKLSSTNEYVFLNSLGFYSEMAQYDEMIKISDEIEGKFVSSKKVLLAGYRLLLESFQLSRAQKCLDLYTNLDPTVSVPDYMRAMHSQIDSLYSDGQVSEDHLLRLLKSAAEAVTNTGNHVVCTDTKLYDVGEFVTCFYINADPETCASTNFKIAEKLVSEFDDSGMSYLSIICRPIKHLKVSTGRGDS